MGLATDDAHTLRKPKAALERGYVDGVDLLDTKSNRHHNEHRLPTVHLLVDVLFSTSARSIGGGGLAIKY